MRIQQVLELTNLSKKAVYFYIKEELINPKKNMENGYYDFSMEDLKKLQVITSLRSIGMSIQDIKELFVYPTLTNFFIHRQINNLKSNIVEQINQLQTAYYLIEKIPANAKPDNLDFSMETLNKIEYKNHSVIDKYFPIVDARMIAILIWAAFTDVEASEYHKFLWEKISNELKYQLENKLSYLKKIVYGLNPKEIHNASVHMYKLSKEISVAEEADLKKFEDRLFNKCKEIIENKNLKEYWGLVYEPVLKPTITFFESEVSNLFSEYNPRYINYKCNMNIIGNEVLKRLKSEPVLLKELIKLMGEKDSASIELNHLQCIYSFNGSIFTQLELDKLKAVLDL